MNGSPFVVVRDTPSGPKQVEVRKVRDPWGGESVVERVIPQGMPRVTTDGSPSLSKKKQLNGRGKPLNKPSAHHRKVEFLTKLAVEALIDRYGLQSVAFMTLTFPEPVYCPKEAQRRLNSLLTNVIRPRYGEYVSCIERHEKNHSGIHYHLVIAVPGKDIRRGFDHAAVLRGDYRSACASLRQEWAFWREIAPRYGFGRVEMKPVRKNGESLAKYMSNYVTKHIEARLPEDKGVRLIRISLKIRPGTTKFSWVNNGAREWRRKVAMFAVRLGVRDLGEFSERYGSKWAYRFREAIITLPDDVELEITEDAELGDSQAERCGGEVGRP